MRSSPTALPQRIRDGEPLVGTFVTSPDPALAEMLAGAFDVLVLDLEHGALDVRDVQTLSLAAQGAGAYAAVRPPSLAADRLAAILDAGVDGIVAPRVERAEEIVELLGRLRYPPQGNRGYGPRRAGEYGRRRTFHLCAAAELACIVQLETRAAIDAATEIAAVDGVDALLFGPADLSFDVGTPLEPSSPAMSAALDALVDAAISADVPWGYASNLDPDALGATVAGRDCRLVLQSVDLRIYARAATNVTDAVRTAVAGEREEAIS